MKIIVPGLVFLDQRLEYGAGEVMQDLTIERVTFTMITPSFFLMGEGLFWTRVISEGK